MASLAVNRLESLLAAKKLDVTLARAWDDVRAPSGRASLDGLLGGGWRRGEISEVVGPRSSGRTSLLVSSLAEAARRGEVVGLVDTFDRFDPPTAAAAGLDLDRVLWVRGVALGSARRGPSIVDVAVQRAIRAADLLIRAGGFGVVALDLADVPARALRALPWTTWRRLAHANEGRETVGLLIGDAPIGRSARGVTVQLETSSTWSGASAQSRRFDALTITAQIVGSRSGSLS
jgi:RecA/RadA recombinase